MDWVLLIKLVLSHHKCVSISITIIIFRDSFLLFIYIYILFIYIIHVVDSEIMYGEAKKCSVTAN